ncbi:MAG: ATP-dependent RNA helicase DbpA [Thermoanaerobaculales bacterium]|nr:ATP-dependent RNA helicase DbpA [Thermoanaerobaculales bacterium]
MRHDFGLLSLSSTLLTVVAELGYEKLTAIQAQSIPVLLQGKDLIGQSKTGSGKTAAFALPILEKLDMEKRSLKALVLCPSRELSAQVAREIRKLGRRHPGLQVLVVSGGEPFRRQASALERGVHIVVGTPGRILDHLRRRTIRFHTVKAVVLDEADRMLDMGFHDDMEQILRALPETRQTVFFSATFPGTIEAMSRTFQHDAVRVTIDDPVEAAPDIRQLLLTTDSDKKLHDLRWLLANHPHESALIFCNLKVTVRELTQTLSSGGVSADCIHGDLEQFERNRVMARFRNQSVRILIATDVAARGIDVADLDLVINYDLPSQPEIYIHRIGRTGRAGKQGLAISLTTLREKPKIKAIEKLTGSGLEPLVRDASFDVGVETLSKALERDAQMETIQISGGRREKIRPGDILGALTGETGGLSASDIGKIEIHDRLSYVAVSKTISQDAVESLNEGFIKGKRFRASLLR